MNDDSKKPNIALRWLIFIKERFDPVSHFVMVSIFIYAHVQVVKFLKIDSSHLLNWNFFAISLGVLTFFFKLRLYDEIKDYKLDCVINPTRPLPRGLLTLKNVKQGIIFCIILELTCALINGLPTLFVMSLSILYSLLMYKEFFVPNFLRPKLTTYAVSHTVISVFLSVILIAALTNQYPWHIPPLILSFCFSNWALFNIFEFGRKTFCKYEEREGVESYSKIFGTIGAVMLTLSQSALAYILASRAIPIARELLGWSFILLAMQGIAFVFYNKGIMGKFYRTFSSFYIIIFFSIIIYCLEII